MPDHEEPYRLVGWIYFFFKCDGKLLEKKHSYGLI